MKAPETDDNSGFSFPVWLRTDRLVRVDVRWGAREVKFNPNHDSQTGRFTFKNGGGGANDGAGPDGKKPQSGVTWGGGTFSGGGGGSFGGGGATGTWGDPSQTASEAGEDAIVRAQTAIARERYDPKVGPGVEVTKNGYTFQIDSLDRTDDVKGRLTLETAPRSRANQASAGGTDRLATDDGGHFIPVRFNGPNNAFNTFAQDANFNRGAYRSMEDGWAKDLKGGKQVFVHIGVHYPGTSTRPDSLVVNWTVNGSPDRQIFRNARKGK